MELSRLRIVAYLEIWLFLWDDEIDQTSGSLSGSPEKAQAFRMATIDAVTYYLGLGDEPSGLRAQGNLIKSFSDIGEALRVHYTLGRQARIQSRSSSNLAVEINMKFGVQLNDSTF